MTQDGPAEETADKPDVTPTNDGDQVEAVEASQQAQEGS